jgi:ATP-dependent Lon protease
VRNLEREIAKLARKAVTDILKGKVKSVDGRRPRSRNILGVQRFRYGLAEKEDQVGVVTGWPGPASAAICCRSRR